MIRFLVRLLIQVLAAAVGLIVAAAILEDMTISGTAFIVAVLIFVAVNALTGPFVAKSAMRNQSALLGAVALVSTLIALVVTAWLSDGLSITGLTTWLLAGVIVWLAGIIAALIIPVLLVKAGIKSARADDR
ncbi:MAG: phage holin family protein [Ilumatobacteraceae bacterium]